MKSAEELVNLILSYNPKTNAKLITEAYVFSEKMHGPQRRSSGEPYFIHPVAVAEILIAQHLDDATIATALLHDTVEDTKSTEEDISTLFGTEVAALVDGVTKLTNLQITTSEGKQAENIRKLLLAMSKDLRVILVKLADRLHNMRTIRHLRAEKQLRKARETMDIFAPLAGRMGMQWMREELEDLSFGVLNPKARESIIRRFAKLKSDAEDVIDSITNDIVSELAKAGITADVVGRAKRPYSIWRKMEEKEQSFSRLSDIYGFRIIVDDDLTCYRALGVVHKRWRAIPGRFKDYISQPKSNGYRSLHTAVSGRDGKRVEIQIRTHRMHDVAETGVAAHWSYRDGIPNKNPFAVDPVKWIASLNEQLRQNENHKDFLEAVKLEMYTDRVFCFTPKGDVVKLPKGACVIDFAYAIHTRIGHTCIAAQVDGARVPLWTKLRNGQSVEIITADHAAPQNAWLAIVQTGKAKSAIRREMEDQDREKFIRLGYELTRAAFEHASKKFNEKALEIAAEHLGYSDRDNLLAAIGRAELQVNDVMQSVFPDYKITSQEEVDRNRAVIGLPAGQTSNRSPCCEPLPGERIVGVPKRGEGVIIHKIDCDVLADYEDEAETWMDLHWHSGTHPAVYSVTLNLVIGNDAGVLGRLCSSIGHQHANISNLNFIDRKPDFFRIRIEIEVRDLEHLLAIMAELKADSDVPEITRLRRSRKPEMVFAE